MSETTKNATAEANAILAANGLNKNGTPKAEKPAKATKPKPGNKEKPAKKSKAELKAAQGNRGTPTAEPLAVEKGKAVKAVQKKTSTEVGQAENGATRGKVFGFSITSVLRYCGWKGWNVARCKVLCAKVGMPLRENCVKAQCGSGRRFASGTNAEPVYGPLAELTKEQFKELEKLAPEPE